MPHLRRLLREGYEVFISLAKRSYRDGELAGQRLDESLLAQLEADHAAGLIDACGENGEYHTWVLNGPLFRQRLLPRISPIEVTEDDRRVVLDSVEFADSTQLRGVSNT